MKKSRSVLSVTGEEVRVGGLIMLGHEGEGLLSVSYLSERGVETRWLFVYLECFYRRIQETKQNMTFTHISAAFVLAAHVSARALRSKTDSLCPPASAQSQSSM